MRGNHSDVWRWAAAYPVCKRLGDAKVSQLQHESPEAGDHDVLRLDVAVKHTTLCQKAKHHDELNEPIPDLETEHACMSRGYGDDTVRSNGFAHHTHNVIRRRSG